MKVIAVLQARTSSSRLPNKVMLPILGKPMLAHQIERVVKSKKIDKLIVATSKESSDNVIEQLCGELGVACFRGNLDDVLDRFYQTTVHEGAEHIVRLTGDCPLADPNVIDSIISRHLSKNSDYTSNSLPPTFPDGLDVEVMTFNALKKAWENAVLLSEREHVTLYLRREDVGNKIDNYENDFDLSDLRWTVDEPEDFKFVSKIYSELYQKNNNFGLQDVLLLLKKQPELNLINSGFTRNEGLVKSLANDFE